MFLNSSPESLKSLELAEFAQVFLKTSYSPKYWSIGRLSVQASGPNITSWKGLKPTSH